MRVYLSPSNKYQPPEAMAIYPHPLKDKFTIKLQLWHRNVEFFDFHGTAAGVAGRARKLAAASEP
jgi:hypothetical protein